MTRSVLLLAPLALALGCRSTGTNEATSSAGVTGFTRAPYGSASDTAEPERPPFEAQLLSAAREYRRWTRVSDGANFAPTRCDVPPPAGVQRSRSTSADTHGRKLYFLFARDPATYHELDFFEDHGPQERADLVRRLVGQAVVKQSWTPVEVPIDQVPELGADSPSGRVTPEDYLVADGRAWRTGEQSDLFVMLKLDPSTPGTDQGWVYGTLTPDGTRVTSSGRVAQCMECHLDAPRDRLFGLFPPRR